MREERCISKCFIKMKEAWPQVRTFTAGEQSGIVWDNSPGTLSSSSRWWSAPFHTLLPIACGQRRGRLSLSERRPEWWMRLDRGCVPEPASPGPNWEAWLGKWWRALYGKAETWEKMPKAFRNEQITICLRRLLGENGKSSIKKERKPKCRNGESSAWRLLECW